jgi:hypothetical protein
MATQPDDGRVWGRPEALDTLGRVPGRGRRWLGTVLGVAAIGTGAYLGFTGPASGATGTSTSAVTTTTPAEDATCGSVGITLSKDRLPAEGIPPKSVLRLSRTNPDGSAELLVPEAAVNEVVPDGDVLRVSVFLRTDLHDQINGANADGSIAVSVLYDAIRPDVVKACRGML